MATYSDSLGNYFLGDMTFPSGDPISNTTKANMGTDLASIVSSSGLRARNIATNSDFDALSGINILHFGANADTIDDRLLFVSGLYNTTIANDNRIYLFNNLGGLLTTTPNTSAGNTNLTNQIYRRRSMDVPGTTNTPENPQWLSTGREVYWAGVSDGNSLALVQFSLGNQSSAGDLLELKFWYGGLLINPDASLNIVSKQYVTLVATALQGNGGGTSNLDFYRRGKAFLDNENFSNTGVNYPFTGATKKQSVKDFEVFNSSSLMGKARNLLIGKGSYPLLIPLLINGTGGLKTWLPVCHYCPDPSQSAYTILMRCYSTAV